MTLGPLALPVTAWVLAILASATVKAFRTHRLRPPARLAALWYRLHPRSTQQAVDVAVLKDRAVQQARAAMTPEDFTGEGVPVRTWTEFRAELLGIERDMEREQ